AERLIGLAETEVPVARDLDAPVLPLQSVAGEQSLDALKEGRFAGGRAVGGIIRERRVVQLRFAGKGFEQGLDLRSEVEGAVCVKRVIKRLDAEAVAGQQQAALWAIPDGEGEHTAQEFDRAAAVFFVEMEDGFGVAMRAVAMAFGFEVGAIIGVIVDFAVEDDGDGVVFVEHGLMAAREINDRETAMGESDVRIEEEAGIVGAAMSKRVTHAGDGRGVEVTRRVFGNSDAADSAHQFTGSDQMPL